MNAAVDPEKFYVSLKILLTNDKGEHLLLKSRIESLYWGGNDFAGGRINQNEVSLNFHQLIDREIKEEIGKDVKYQLRKDPVAVSVEEFPKGRTNATYILFEAKYISGKVVISEEHIDFQWAKITKQNYKKLVAQPLQKLMKNYFDWNK